MAEFLQYTFNGLWIGAVFGLLALGWVLVMRVSGLLFFPQGEFVIVSAFVAIGLLNGGVPLLVAAAAAVATSIAVALLMDFALVRHLRRATPLSEAVVLLGVALIIGLVIEWIAGPDDRLMEAFLPEEPIEVGGAFITPHQVFAVGVAGVVAALLALVLGRTWLGRAMRACAENREGALLAGIRPDALRSLGFVLAAALGAVAGLVVAPLGSLGPTEGLVLSLKGFIAAVLGRWTFAGAVAAAVLLGLAENYGAGYVSSVYKDVISLGVLVVALLIQSALPTVWRRWRDQRSESAVPDEAVRILSR